MHILHHMDLVWLEDFIALERLRNFTKAAALRNTTQPAYSRRIQNLEQWMGVALFDRATRPVTLTPAGQTLAEKIKQVRGDIIDLRRIVGQSASVLENPVRIYTTNTIAVGYLPNYIQKNHITNYAVTVTSITACLEHFRENKADLVLLPDFIAIEDKFETKILYNDALVLCGPPAFSVRKKRFSHPFLSYSPGTAYGAFLKNAFDYRYYDMVLNGESASAEALLAMVRGGLGCAFIPQSLIKSESNIITARKFRYDYNIIQIGKHS